ncbi:MAG TPA: ABC transporter permease [Solirubrobacteraceae bacterium]|jgi:ABC-type transport system involved in multi-copper enzyme maturation permease subunit
MNAAATTATAALGARPAVGGDVNQARVLRSEWTKLWSLRSTRWSLLFAVISMAGLGVLIAAVSMSRWSHLSPHDRATFDSIGRSLGGYHLAQLAIGVLGVLVISGEYSTGMIRSSLMAVPRRLPVLWAKIGVFASVTFVLMLVSAFIAFFGAQAILTEHHVNVSLGDPHALRALIGTVLFMTVTGILCVALGTIVRSTAGGIATFAGLLFVLPGIVAILPSELGDSISPYLPSSAGGAIAAAVPDAHTLSPWGGFALYCGYTIVLLAVAAYLLVRRDA